MAAKVQSDEAISDINIVPLVDIILVVLIIFMVTVPTAIQSQVPVDLPEASSADSSTESSTLNLSISGEGRVFLNNEEVHETRAREIARAEIEKNPEVQVIVSADQGVDYGLVIRAMDWIKSVGAKSFSITTDQPLEAQ